MKKVFISYRRDDTQAIAGRLYDGLESRLGKDSVFFDIDSIPLGTDFREHVKATLDRCGVLLVLIGSKWLETTRDGRRRLDDHDDLVRVEVEAALERRIPVVPVLIDQTPMPGAAQLPGTLSALAYRNAVRIDSGIDFWNHLARLIAGIAPYVGSGTTSAAPAAAPPPAQERMEAEVAVERSELPLVLLNGAPDSDNEAGNEAETKSGNETTAESPSVPAAMPMPATAESRRPWIVGAFAALMLLLVYAVLSFRLAGAVDKVDASMQALAFPQPASARAPTAPAHRRDLATLLQPEIDKGLLTVIPSTGLSTVRIPSDRLFANGSATVEAVAAPILSRVALALRDMPGQIVVTGHTDNAQIRTLRFPSSFHLTDERARAVAEVLVRDGVAAERVRSEGRADGDALAANDTPANRALNRRIDVTLYEPFVLSRPVAPKGGS